MNFTEMVNRVADRADLSSASAIARIGKSINECYREVASSVGLDRVERGFTTAMTIEGTRTMTFSQPGIVMTASTYVGASATPVAGALATAILPAVGGVISFDNAKAGGTNTNVSTVTVSYTVGGSGTLLIAGVVGDLTADLVTGVTYNGVAMTLIGKAKTDAGWLYFFGLISPATGTHNLVITAGANCSTLGCEITSYIGTSLTTLYQTVQSSTAPTGAQIATTLSPPVAGAWVLQLARTSAGQFYNVTAQYGGATANIRATEALATLTDSGALAANAGVQKLLSVYNTVYSPPLILTEVSYDQIRNEPLINDPPIEYAIQNVTYNSVSIILDSLVTQITVLTADSLNNVPDLSGAAIPSIPEDYHDLFLYYALEIEFDKKEKGQTATKFHEKYEKRLGELRYYLIKSAYLDIVPGMNQQLTVSRNVPLV